VPITLLQADEKYEPCGDCWPPKIVSRADQAPMKFASSGATSAPSRNSSESGGDTRSRAAPSVETPPRSVSGFPGTTPTGIPFHVRPRGGVFHYSKSGKKVYERKRK
jgi:hypothetical protein